MAHDVFISHSTEDKSAADAVCAILEKNGVRCWIAPRDIMPGADWGESIVDAIRASRVLLLLFSTNANKSRQIKREVEIAADGSVTVVPLRIENIVPSDSFEYFLGNIHWLDALTPPLEKHLEEVAAKIKGILSIESVSPSEVSHPPLLVKPPAVQPPAHRNLLPVICGIIAVLIAMSVLLFFWRWRTTAPPAPVQSAPVSGTVVSSSVSPVSMMPIEAVPWQARHGMTSAEYQQVFNDLKGQGYRLIDVSGYEMGGQDRYAAIWEERPGPPWEARHGLTSAQYQQTFDDLLGKGYRLVHVSGYGVREQDFYAAIWEKRSGPPWQARHGMTSAEYQQVFNDLKGQGYRLIDVSGYEVGGQDRYAAIWEQRPGPPWEARHGLTSAQYQQTFDDLLGKGYRLVHVSGYGVREQDFYAAIWEKRSGPPWQARHSMTSAGYQQVFNDLTGQGYRLINVSGYNIGGQDRYAAIWSK